MKISFISILFGFAFIVSSSAQAWTLDEEWIVDGKHLSSINRFFCEVTVIAGSEDQSDENETEEEEEPDCD